MNIVLIRHYPKIDKVTGKQKLDKNGEPIEVFRYRLTGERADLDRYEEIMSKGGFTCQDEGGYVWSTTRAVPRVTDTVPGRVLISSKDKVFADVTHVALADSVIKQYPGPLGLMLAKEILDKGPIGIQPEAEVEQTSDKLD